MTIRPGGYPAPHSGPAGHIPEPSSDPAVLRRELRDAMRATREAALDEARMPRAARGPAHAVYLAALDQEAAAQDALERATAAQA
jgi:hypothetical protein